MAWGFILLTAILWFCGVFILKVGLQINKKTHKDKDVSDYTITEVVGDSSIIGFIISILFSITVGAILKYSPYWVAKSLIIIVACISFILGILSMTKIWT